MADTADTDFLIEFVRIGNSVKVSAIDPATGVEVSIVGPANFSQFQLGRNAIAKLRYALARRQLAPPKT